MSLFGSILGALGIGSNLLGTALDYKSVKDTNKTNLEIADRNNQTAIGIHNADMAFNESEAEKNRQFQAEQAQITREWNSEQAVMHRRKEAGLNTANTDGSITAPTSSPSGAQASSPSVPTLQTPTMQAPQIAYGVASAVQSAIDLAKAPSEIRDTETNVRKSEKDIDAIDSEIGLRKAQETAQNVANAKDIATLSTSIGLLKEELKNLRKTNANLEVDTLLKAATAQQTNEAVITSILSSWQEIHMNKFSQQLDIAQMHKDIALEAQRLDMQCKIAMQKFHEDRLKNSFDLGPMAKYVASKLNSSQWNINGSASLDIGNSLTPVSGSIGINGGYQKGNSIGDTSETLKRSQNFDYMNEAAKLKLASIYLMRSDVPFAEKLKMLDKYTDALTSLKETLDMREIVKGYLGNSVNLKPVTLPSQYLE